jgi:2-polyprenyl-6-methoxyphenol hydroxylase-like FAD-dependent oxidoreductase
VPVLEDVDILVLGGSCTGVFAAVRAARMGARVALVERANCFGGTATCGDVNVWHSLQDTLYEREIIGGLTREVVDRLARRGATSHTPGSADGAFRLNTEELKIELDELVREAGVIPWLHTLATAPYVQQMHLGGVFVESKSGRGAIRARYVIDATGDADLCRQLGLPGYRHGESQPSTVCARVCGIPAKDVWDWRTAVAEHGHEFGIEEIWGWSTFVPGLPDTAMWAETRLVGHDCADARQLTVAEMEGRRQVRAQMDVIRKYAPEGTAVGLADLASLIGIRDTWHVRGKHQLTEEELLGGVRFDDAIANGTYRVDIHHHDRFGITFRYLDGVEEVKHSRHEPTMVGRWRPESAENPTFYQIPYRCIVPGVYDNLLMAGRMIDADPGAFGAVRVMVNLNQVGEAAGVAAAYALEANMDVADLEAEGIRARLAAGGSIML